MNFIQVKSHKSVVALFLAVIMVLSSFLWYQHKVDASLIDEASPDLSRVEAKDSKFVDKWEQSSAIIDKMNDELQSHSDSIRVEQTERHIMKVQQGSVTSYFSYYPIKGDDVEKDSRYVIVFNKKGKVVNEYLLLGLKADANQTETIVKRDGVTVVDALISSEGNIVSGTVIHSNGEIQHFDETTVVPQSFWSCLNDCLASQGIAAWAITALGILCAVACVGTAGLGCFGCLLAADIGAGAVVGYCVGICR